jgi:hypothetical protein
MFLGFDISMVRYLLTSTLIIPFSEGGLITCVCGEISEGDTKFLHATRLVAREDLGFWELKVSKCRKLSKHALFDFLMLGDALGVSD